MKIVCIGDSLTEGLGVDKGKSWPEVLGKLGNMEVINKGISGDTTTGMVGRFYYDVIYNHPNYTIIMGGGNDLWWDLPVNIILSNVYSMVKQSIHHNITPIIGIPTPLFLDWIDHESIWEPIAGYSDLEKKLSILVNELRNMAKRNDWHFIDFHHLYRDENGIINRKYFLNTDGIHPNEKGHQDMAELALNYFKNHFHSENKFIRIN
jgi:acyl-CoA thioesterase I